MVETKARAKTKVSLTKGGSRADNVRQALRLIENEIDLRGKSSVFVKVNFVSTQNQLAATHVDAVRSLLEFLRARYDGKITVGESAAETAKFMVTPNSACFTEDGRRVAPGSGERGLLAVSGYLPVGYYKDPEKTARTFHVYEGRRWSVPGDWATVEADGSLRLLGRGSQVINTGGEKVFPEEVEEAIKRLPGVRDAAAVGVPDARFGERVCAVVDMGDAPAPTLAEVSAHVRQHLAAYKAPRELVIAPITRAANGKLDYKGVRAAALRALNIPA